MWSYATWVRQVDDGLLPEAEFMLLTDNDRPDEQFGVRWADALRLAGDQLEEEADFDPPRWRYHGWPGEATLAALRASTVPPPA